MHLKGPGLPTLPLSDTCPCVGSSWSWLCTEHMFGSSCFQIPCLGSSKGMTVLSNTLLTQAGSCAQHALGWPQEEMKPKAFCLVAWFGLSSCLSCTRSCALRLTEGGWSVSGAPPRAHILSVVCAGGVRVDMVKCVGKLLGRRISVGIIFNFILF